MVVGLATEVTENQCCTLVWEKKSHKASNWGGHVFGKCDWHTQTILGKLKDAQFVEEKSKERVERKLKGK